MHVHDAPPDRRRADLQIQRAFTVTLAGFWITILLVFWCFLPIGAPGVWPLLDIVETSSGRRAPFSEGDVFISVVRGGDVYLWERKATLAEVTRACSPAAITRSNWRGGPYQSEIFVRVDRAAPFGAVRAVVLAAQDAHVDRITFTATAKQRYELTGHWY